MNLYAAIAARIITGMCAGPSLPGELINYHREPYQGIISETILRDRLTSVHKISGTQIVLNGSTCRSTYDL